jgi:hypothetical protein
MPINPVVVLNRDLLAIPSHPGAFMQIHTNGTQLSMPDISGLITQLNASTSHPLNIKKINNQSVADFTTYAASQMGSHTHSNKAVLDTINANMISDWSAKQDALAFTPENISNKGVANGYTPLNSSGVIANTYLPSEWVNRKISYVVDSEAERLLITSPVVGSLCLVVDTDAITPGHQSIVYICTDNTPGNIVWAAYCYLDDTEIVIGWNLISGIPSAAAAAIDAMVTNTHSHTNTSVLNNFAITGGHLTHSSRQIMLGAKKSRSFSNHTQAVSIATSTIVLGPTYTPATDTLWRLFYNGLKLCEGKDYTFVNSTKTITLLNGLTIGGTDQYIEYTKHYTTA